MANRRDIDLRKSLLIKRVTERALRGSKIRKIEQIEKIDESLEIKELIEKTTSIDPKWDDVLAEANKKISEIYKEYDQKRKEQDEEIAFLTALLKKQDPSAVLPWSESSMVTDTLEDSMMDISPAISPKPKEKGNQENKLRTGSDS